MAPFERAAREFSAAQAGVGTTVQAGDGTTVQARGSSRLQNTKGAL
ncbi:hypothetical protein [Microbacterium mitrae]|nr:hypothetical protein [Microbacterium mitrae]